MGEWIGRTVRKAGLLLLNILGFIILVPLAVWFGSAQDWLLKSVFGEHHGAVWGTFFWVVSLGIGIAVELFLVLMLTGGVNWPWVVRRRRRAAEAFYLKSTVPLYGRNKTVRFEPRHVLFTSQPRAALGLDESGNLLRLMSLDGRGDVTIDLRLIERAVFVPARTGRGAVWWLRNFWKKRLSGLRLYLHVRDYDEPVIYLLAVADADKQSLRRFQSVLRSALHQEKPRQLPSSREWAAVLPRYSGFAQLEDDGYWPPRPRHLPQAA